MAAFIHHNGPVSAGINANVFGMREKGCEAKGNCFITADNCNDPQIKGKGIDHSITVVGYGTDKKNGDYWIIKNSWSSNFANGGFINVARGINCASMCSSPGICGNVNAAGDPASYFE
jgi:cathepsin L